MKLSEAGLGALKFEEGLRLDAYLDEAGKPTIGYGHLIRPGEAFSIITEPEAEALLRQDVESAERCVSLAVAVPLTQAQFDSLVLFAFNVGESAFRKSTMLKMLNAGDYEGARAQFGRWKYVTQAGVKQESPGLRRRRAREAALFAGAGYSEVA
jgi:lysozyme